MPLSLDAPLPYLAGLTAREFVRDYWQKKPLYIPGAFAGFTDLADLATLQKFACRDDVVSRLVTHDHAWDVIAGPFEKAEFKKLPEKWALLIQNLNHLLPEADALLQKFSFIPYARLDDLMVSYAPAGGGVGPHFDSYDVFLLQGSGEKHWQIATQTNPALIPDIPLRILADFVPEQAWTLAPGDMLYLPPRCAHYGVQLSPGTTYSIGFRAPSHTELASQFLMHLAENMALAGAYADPDITLPTGPGEISTQMIQRCKNLLDTIQWDATHVADFLGAYLSEPKSHVWFDGPAKPLALAGFTKRLAQQGVVLNAQTQCLYHDAGLFINGEACPLVVDLQHDLRTLADNRRLVLAEAHPELIAYLYELYTAGYLHLA